MGNSAPLRIAPFPENGKVVEGERLNLVCGLSSGDAPVEIQWTMVPTQSHRHSAGHRFSSSLLKHTSEFPDQEERKLRPSSQLSPAEEPALFSVLNTDPFTSLLSIPRVMDRHAGLYVCNVSSAAAGTTLRSHDLTVLGMTRRSVQETSS